MFRRTMIPQTAQSILIASTVVSTFIFLMTITALPIFFMKVQRVNSQMLSQLRSCHQDSTDLWKQLSQESLRGKRAYGRDGPSIPNGKCCSCQQGKPGALGAKGSDGAPGQAGLIGLNGRNGKNGKYVASENHNEPACQKCPVAPPGPPGHPGRKGPRGTGGNAGTSGKNGIPGRMGPPGPAGVRGPPGELGMQGPQGDPGKVLNGAPQGQPGRPGRVGPRGKTGFTGRDGRPGLEGTPGTRGVQGERGSRGARGPPGPPGPAGVDGRRGSCTHCNNEKDQQNSNDNLSRSKQSQSVQQIIDRTTVEPTPTHIGHPPAAPLSVTLSTPTESSSSEKEYSEIVPKTINYPDTIVQPSHKHDGDVTGNLDDTEDIIPAGRYSTRQYASKTIGGKSTHFGYSNDQLSVFAPMSFAGNADSYGKPRAFQTNKGYNVQILGTGPTYSAAPVVSGWQQPENQKTKLSGINYLPPPAYL